MRILQICAVDFTAYHMLRPLMHALRDDGWQVEFACGDGSWAAKLRAEGFGYRTAPIARSLSPRRQLHAILALRHALRADPPDLIHTHTPAGGVVGRLAALLAGVRAPIVHTFHGLPFERQRLSPIEAAYLAIERVLAQRTRYFFSQARGDARRAADLGIARAGDILVIGNGVDTSRFRPDAGPRTETRAELSIADTALVSVTVARLVREKGLLDLADAALALGDLDRMHVLLAGTTLPSDRNSIEAELGQHPVREVLGTRWRQLGHVDHVERLLQAADLFVLPTYREGLPRSIIEAMACGLPVVATDIPGCHELVLHGETGLLVAPRDPGALAAAMRRLLCDVGERRAMGEAARRRALEQHDERLVIRRQLDVLRGIVAAP